MDQLRSTWGQCLDHSDCTTDGRSRGFCVQREGTRDPADGLGTPIGRGNEGFYLGL